MVDYIRKNNPRSTRLRLTLDRDGEIVVTAPPYVTKAVIERFLRDNEGWIKTQQARRPAARVSNGGEYRVFGHTYRLEFGYDARLPSGWQIDGERLLYNNSAYLLSPKTTPTLTAKEKQLLEQFGRRTLSTYINKRLPQLHAQMHLTTPVRRITIKDQSTRWGSCSSNHNLNFNWRLVNFAPAVIDYVLIHELAHLVYMDHSDKFWALVAKYDGQYKLHRQLLNH